MGCTCASSGYIYEPELSNFWKTLPIRKMTANVYLNNLGNFHIDQIKEKKRDEFISVFFIKSKDKQPIVKNMFFSIISSMKRDDINYFLICLFFLTCDDANSKDSFIQLDKIYLNKCIEITGEMNYYTISKVEMEKIIEMYINLISYNCFFLDNLFDNRQDFIEDVRISFKYENQIYYIKQLLKNYDNHINLDDFFNKEYKELINDSIVREKIIRFEFERLDNERRNTISYSK